ncbi:serine hydrolase domain-containing protein [Demequina rhizosphaerae]|uniref:serine hydrolase domain-containing protein n=1 Tax=Demequina rhizosphaerae TaxID=1638985 RepID=UPI000784776F|nr:serine hydrolase domain-containing protein [Demequina rhizosphaerae]
MRHLLAITALGLSAALGAAIPSGTIDDYITAEMPSSGAPGVAYAVVTDGEVTEVGARGVTRAGSDTAVTPDTPFVIGSISKSFTALAVMQLVEAGQVDLDAPAGDYVDALADTPAGAPTVRKLLSHTSGFSTVQGNTTRASSTGAADDLANAVAALADEAPEYPPGTTWEYSNTNYQILGRLIEEVAGTEFQAYVTAHILDPVGMDDSFVADGEVHPEIATGHTPWFWTKRPLAESPTDRVTAPQGGIVASANDVALYLAMVMNGEDDVLSAEGKAEMMRPASAVSPFYGLGWYVDTSDGTVGHTGSTPGIETQATMVPAQDDAVVVLVNGGSGVGFGETTQLRYGITAIALGLDYDGEGSRWAQKALFVGLTLAPFVYLASMAWAWAKRDAVRAKTRAGVSGLFSLWFPLLTTGVAAWVLLTLVPNLMGAPPSTVRVFQPDMALAMTATAVGGVVWAAFRLAIAYTGKAAVSPR